MYYAITLFGEPGAEIIYPDQVFQYTVDDKLYRSKAVPIDMLEKKDFSINPKNITLLTKILD